MAQGNEVLTYPSWRYGPAGESMICYTAEQVPAGWHDTPDKHKTPAPAATEGGEPTRKEMLASLAAKGVAVKGNISNANLRELFNAEPLEEAAQESDPDADEPEDDMLDEHVAE